METYIDSDGNEFTIEQLKGVYGESWADGVKELGLTLKKESGVVAVDATVTPGEEDTVSELVETSLDGVDQTSNKITIPKDRKYEDTFKIPNFKEQDNKDIVNAYNNLYGGTKGGFTFASDNNTITIKSLSGKSIVVDTNEYIDAQPRGFDGPGLPGYYTDKKKSQVEETINGFVKDNFDEDLNKENTKQLDILENQISKDLPYYIREFAKEEDLAIDSSVPIGEMLNNPEFVEYITPKITQQFDSSDAVSVSGGGVLDGYQIDTSIRETMQALSVQELINNEDEYRKTVINPLVKSGEWKAVAEGMKSEHVQAIVNPEEKRLAEMGLEINSLFATMQAETGSSDDYQKNNTKLNKLINARNLATKSVLGKDTTFLFDPKTKSRISKVLVDSGSGITVEDLTDDYNNTKVALRKRLATDDWDTITSDYNLHNVENREFNNAIASEKFDIKVDKNSFQEGSPLGERLADLGYKTSGGDWKQEYDDTGIFKDVSMEDLMKVSYGIDPNSFKGLIKEVGEGDENKSGSLQRRVENNKETQKRIALERGAWKNLYLLNIDPGSVKADDLVSLAGNFAAGVIDALPGGDPEFRRMFVSTDRDELNDTEALIEKVNSTLSEDQLPIELTEEQKDSFEEGVLERIVTGTGSFVPMIAELAAVSYLTGGMGNAAGIANYLSKLKTVTYLSKVKGARNSIKALDAVTMAARAKKAGQTVKAYAKAKGFAKASGSAFQKAQALAIMAIQEEGKMKLTGELFGFDMPLGAGAGFVLGGAAVKNFLPGAVFRGQKAGLNFIPQKLISGGIGGTAGAQTAAPLEALIKDLKGTKDFRTFIDEKYPSFEEWAEDAFIEMVQFSFVGVHNLSKADLTVRMQSKRNLLTKTRKSLVESSAKGEKDKVVNDMQLIRELESQIAVSENRMRFLDKDVLAADTQYKLEKFNRQFAKENGGETSFDFKLQVNGKGMTKGNVADVNFAGKKPKITVDMSKVNEGTLPHELYHLIKEQIFGADPASQVALQNKLSTTVKSMDFNLAEGDLKTAVEKAYEKTQSETTLPEEFNSNLVDLLSRPEFKDKYITKNIFGEIRNDLYGFFETKLGDTALKGLLPKLETPEAIIDFLSRYGTSIGKGNYNKGMIERYKSIRIDKNNNLIDIKTGEKLNKSKAEQKSEKVAQRDIAKSSLEISKTNKESVKKYEEQIRKLEENKDMKPEMRQRIKDDLTSKLKGELYFANEGLLQEYINKYFDPKLGLTRESFESEVVVEMLDKIIPPFIKRGEKFKDYDFGAYARLTLFPGGFSPVGRIGNILGRLGVTKENMFKKDLEGKEAQSKTSETNEFEFGKEVLEEKLTDPRSLDKFPGGKTDSMEKIVEAIEVDLQNRDLTQDTFKSLIPGEQLAKVWGEIFGLNPKLMYDIAGSGTKKGKEVSAAQTINANESFALADLRLFINNNSQKIINLLPDAQTLEGKSTGISNKVLDLYYFKNSKGKWQRRNDISITDIKNAMEAPSDAALYRSAEANIVKGINKLVFKGILNKVAREKMLQEGGSANDIQKLASGKNPKMAQKTLEFVNEQLPKGLELSKETLSNYVDQYTKDPIEFAKKRPVLGEVFDNLSLELITIKTEEGKGDKALNFKNAIKASQESLPKGVSLERIIDGVTGKGMFAMKKVDKVKVAELYDMVRIEEYLNQAEAFASTLPKFITDILGTGETFTQSLGLGTRPTAKGIKTILEGKSETPKLDKVTGEEVGNIEITKNQADRMSDALGTSDFVSKLFDKLVDSSFRGEGAQKSATVRAFGKMTEVEKKAELKKYINKTDNKAKTDIYWAMEAAKQEWLYKSRDNPGEFEAKARYIYQTAANNSSLIKGYARQFVPIKAVLFEKGMSIEKMKLEHVKSSLEQSMQAAKAVVEGKWVENGEKIMDNFSGIISYKKYLDVIDEKGGTTNTSGMARMVLDLQNLKKYRTVESGFKETLYDAMMIENAQRVGAKLRQIEAPWLMDAAARLGFEPSKPNELLLKTQLDNQVKTKEAWKADVDIAKKAGTLSDPKSSKSEILNQLSNRDKAVTLAQKQLKPVKKARVFDFDDTLAKSKSNVLYTMPDGVKGKLNATEFAKRSEVLESQGAKFDFSEFSKVIKGSKGPLFDLAKMMADSPGSRDMFVLTARPSDAAPAIQRFLKGLGLDIPIENITGLSNGAATAKSNWILEKAAEGYNDFYFADDAIKNVKAVKSVLDVIDVKGTVQQALAQRNLNKSFNEIIQEKSGVGAEKIYSKAKADIMGKNKGRFDYLISPGAEDFTGLLYKTLPKGKKGEAALEFYKKSLLEPFSRAEDNLTRDQVALGRDITALKNTLKIKTKELKKVNETGFTNEQSIRVRLWTKMGEEIPGLSKSDLKEINDVVRENPRLESFANELLSVTKNDGWAKPIEEWLSGDLTSDARSLLGTTKRSKYLEEWQRNVDEIFTKPNLNKLEATYGKDYRDALVGTLARMKSGRNRTTTNNLEGRVLDYLNNSVGTIMFLNTRSAVLQTISSANFINWTDNNPLAAGKALANRKQYAKDFMEIMNSDYLVGRRNGLKLNINEAEIFDSNGAKGIINKILKKGFVFTQYADSFAIATGGATFYRNRTKTYMKEGMSEVDAKAKAFMDFKELSEESQQSSRTDKISQQQASNLGRVVLAFANTPMQYARIQKKAIQDIAAGRGDWKSNLSKVVYYGFVQNLMFNLIQNAMFGIAFGDEETSEKLKTKSGRVVNGMADSILRGMGLAGAGVAMTKNALLTIAREAEKERPKYSKAIYDVIGISPTIGSKTRKIKNALEAAEYGAFDNGFEFGLESPSTMAVANVISATVNIPVDRALKKAQNIEGAINDNVDFWQRVSMLSGFADWELGVDRKEQTNSDTMNIDDFN